MRFITIFLLIFAVSASTRGGMLPLTQPYLEQGGYVAGSGRFYHGAATATGDTWTEVEAGAIANPFGYGYVQSLPDGDAFSKTYDTGASIDYKMTITTPGIYILWLRWDGVDDSSNSMFAGIPELADGLGGNVDWYEVFNVADANFNTDPWDAMGGFEANDPAPARIPMAWNITTPGTYTLHVVTREDGAALDSWIFQLYSLIDPTNANPVITVPDSALIPQGGSVDIPVLSNDAGAIVTSTVEIVTAPVFGTATPLPDGRIAYVHTNDSVQQDSFSYRVIGSGGSTSAPASVVVSFSVVTNSNGNLPLSQPYVENGYYVAGEAEFYHGISSALGDTWTYVPDDGGAVIANVLGTGYMQALPDGDAATKDYDTGATLEYKMQIAHPGIYILWLRWDGIDNGSDSVFAGIPELADGPGGNVDWYELYDNADANFNTDPWDSLGGFESDDPAPVRIPMSWNIPTSGVYTLRLTVREDGAAIDSWIFQSFTVADPTNTNPIIAVPDSIEMHHHAKAGIPVLANDSGAIIASSIQIVTPPIYGTATPTADGKVLYHHTSGAPAEDHFMYRVRGTGGTTSSPTHVAVTFTSDARIPNHTVNMPLTPPPTTYQVVDAFPGITFTAPTSMESPPGDTNRIYVTQRNGNIYVVTGITSTNPQKQLFMNISSRVDDDGNELGMKGITFHPGFATNGFFFVTYCNWDGSNRRVRLSRFKTLGGNPNAGDASSELMLINQKNDQNVHNIDDILYGPDGYLYLGMGDEGFANNQPDGENNSQRIDKDIWSAILRIDPDKKPGNLEPNAHSGIPTNASGQAYFSIPSNNPFIGATQFNGIAVNPSQVRTEFFVVGVRNPWQFNFDAMTGELWAPDVGNDAHEEVNVFAAGDNGGWVFYEGNSAGPRGDKTPPAGFVWKRPVWTYNHGFGEFLGLAITGGFVYRGANYPTLYGKYLCSDYVSGNIWTVERTAGATNVVRITGEGGLIQFGQNPGNGDIIMLDHGDGRIRKLVAETPQLAFPQTLSETGFFADLSDLAPNPGVVAYQPNLPFWSDYAIKSRWFVITGLSEQVMYSRDGNWTFPAGMMWVKHFDYDLDHGNTNTRTRIETRVIVRTTNGAYGVSYRWNTNGTEATLVGDAGVNFTLNVTNQGVAKVQQWRIPSRAECLVCHTPAGGHALSFNTRQLNCTGNLAGQSGNQISLLDDAGYIGNAIDDPATLPRHVRPDEVEFSLEARARSYFAVNCGYCHMGAQSIVPGTWDGRAFVKLADAGIIMGAASSNGGNTNNFYVVPKDTAHSIIWNRMAATNGFTRMPPLGTYELDYTNIGMIAEWINGELAAWQNYAMWRQTQFGGTNSPEGEKTFDADGDGRSNYEEYLTRTNPNDDTDYWTGYIRNTDDGGLFVDQDLYNRSVVFEMTTDLVAGTWARWNVDGNDGLPVASGMVQRLMSRGTNEAETFRFRVEEQ